MCKRKLEHHPWYKWKPSLWYRLSASYRFHNAKVYENENILRFIAHIIQRVATIKSMNKNIKEWQTAMEFWNWLPIFFGSIKSALDAARIDDDEFSFELG